MGWLYAFTLFAELSAHPAASAACLWASGSPLLSPPGNSAFFFCSSMGLWRNWSSVGACAAILHGVRLSVVQGWCVPMPSALTQPPDWVWEQFLQALSCSCQSGYKEWVLSVGLWFFFLSYSVVWTGTVA